ncbi:hypothetical protein [Ancylomarina sp. 16SWW S1-10-2]|uniref:hypothetical protein n=1 Tax=Ancylomarina sp. 16SWW S1-10-2 TaxID=2499681 RepID=UPI0012ADC314|nr:hypothetical protein [Ancylomarina sp. 16SWW S1-10-2]MRT92656.1 hypothetical protein [Ancylomarina sp. 16SWW S1-10-2]
MRIAFFLVASLFLFLNTEPVFSQEWKNLKKYQNETHHDFLEDGCWLKKDRRRNTENWKLANQFNLTVEKGYLKYKTISQVRDFYLWFDVERKKLGQEINAVGVAAIVAGQLSKFDNFFIRAFIVRNREVVWFGNEGAKSVFAFAFPLLNEIYFSDRILKGQEAIDWDIRNGKIEQCEILEPIYNQLSPVAIRRLERMAKGKGIFWLGVPKSLKFEKSITDCEARYEHAFTKVYQYYLSRENKNVD